MPQEGWEEHDIADIEQDWPGCRLEWRCGSARVLESERTVPRRGSLHDINPTHIRSPCPRQRLLIVAILNPRPHLQHRRALHHILFAHAADGLLVHRGKLPFEEFSRLLR